MVKKDNVVCTKTEIYNLKFLSAKSKESNQGTFLILTDKKHFELMVERSYKLTVYRQTYIDYTLPVFTVMGSMDVKLKSISFDGKFEYVFKVKDINYNLVSIMNTFKYTKKLEFELIDDIFTESINITAGTNELPASSATTRGSITISGGSFSKSTNRSK